MNNIDLPLGVSLPNETLRVPLLLVVDDQTSNIQILFELFENSFEVCMATNGADALAFCQRRQPDLILLDVVMPGMGGYEVCQKLKSDPLTQDIPIIFVTAKTDPSDEVEAFSHGGVDFISKPFHEIVVRARVQIHLTLKHQSDLLRSLALVDGLTGIANRRHFDATLQAEWRRCSRSTQPLSLILVDIDYFKRYNDQYGHPAGDLCLKNVAATLKKNFSRSHDLVARYGGEEFACILPDTQLSGAENKARALELAIRAMGIPNEKSELGGVITVSVGVAAANPCNGEDPSGLIVSADQQLYLAKYLGRGQMRSAQIPVLTSK